MIPYMTKQILLSATALAATACIVCSCSKLSSEAKEIAGDYYIPEISQDTPLMELNPDGTCIMRAIKPGVLTINVPGEWNVLRDTLFIDTDPDRLTSEGDSTLIGNIPPRLAKAVVGHTDVTLTLETDGVQYVYLRRGKQ